MLRIDSTKFGNITIDGKKYKHDVYVTKNGKIKKRKKKLSKTVFGTSHKVSLEEIKEIYEEDANVVIIGTGQMGILRLSIEALKFLEKKRCETIILRTKKAIKVWNNDERNSKIALFHVSC